jgi:competence protein ComEC
VSGRSYADRRGAARWTWVDLRLVPVGVAVWAGALVAPFLAPPMLALAATLALGLAAVVGRRRGPAAALALALLAGIALTAGVGALHGVVREGSPLRPVAEAGRTVLVVLELDGDPHELAGPGGPRVVADATVTELRDGATRHRLTAGVLLFAPADGWRDLLPGQDVRVRVRAALPGPGDDTVAVVSARGPPTLLGDPGPLQTGAGALRDGLAAAADRVLEPRAAGLLPGLVVGDTRGMDPVLDEEFRQAGLAHLTAVSGANVAIVLAGVLWPLRRRAVDRRVQAVVAGLVLVGFVILARPSPSVVRAAAMGAVMLLALASGRARAAVPALAAAAIVLLLLDPGLARDPGFALSVAATGGIVLLAPGWSRRLRLRGCPPLVADAVAVSAAAGMVTAPLVAGLTGTVSLISLPANLLAAPAVAPATVLGLVAALVPIPVPPVADALVWLAGWPTRWLVLVAERAAAVPDGATGWPAGTEGAVLLTLLLLAGGWALWRFARLRPLALAALVGVVAVGWPLRQAVRGWPPPETVAVACDVGQGDAFVIPTGPGAGILVDAGPDVGAVDRCLDRLGIEALPLVLLSHLDADHVGGLSGALTGRDVGAVATGTLSPADERAGRVDGLVRRAEARREVLVPGDQRRLGPATVEVLAPAPERATASAEPNDLSLVARITVRGIGILFTGDLGAEAEARLLDAGTDLRADVFKVPHHGSGDADPGFLAASGARVALLSVGADNSYGHPTAGTLRRLTQAGMTVYRTDRGGDLAVAGSSLSWGVAVRGSGGAAAAAHSVGPPDQRGVLFLRRSRRPRAGTRSCRRPVTPCRRAGPTRGTDLTPARGDGGGGAAPLPGGLCRAIGGPRAPPRHRGARARRGRPARR